MDRPNRPTRQPVPPVPPVKLGAKRLAVRLALDPERRLQGNGHHLICFSFKRNPFPNERHKKINFNNPLQLYERNPFKSERKNQFLIIHFNFISEIL